MIDGRGQRDDIGYPMSVPSWRDHGAEIAAVGWDGASRTGMVRLDLEPAYPEDLGVLLYERDLLFPGGRRIVVRDRVVLAEPRTLSWLFHARDDIGLAPEEGLRFRAGTDPYLSIEPGPADVRLSASVGGTDVVYSYTPFKPVFVHIRYDTAAPVSAATVDYAVVW